MENGNCALALFPNRLTSTTRSTKRGSEHKTAGASSLEQAENVTIPQSPHRIQTRRLLRMTLLEC